MNPQLMEQCSSSVNNSDFIMQVCRFSLKQYAAKLQRYTCRYKVIPVFALFTRGNEHFKVTREINV